MRTYPSQPVYAGAVLATLVLAGRALAWGAKGSLGVAGYVTLALLDRYLARSDVRADGHRRAQAAHGTRGAQLGRRAGVCASAMVLLYLAAAYVLVWTAGVALLVWAAPRESAR